MAVTAKGALWAWGGATDEELGSDTPYKSYTPYKIAEMGKIVSMSTTGPANFAVDAEGTVWAWGEAGLLGIGRSDEEMVDTRVQVKGLSGVVALSGRMALESDGEVWTWGPGPGDNGAWQDRPMPVRLPFPERIVAISVGRPSLALGESGAVYDWGTHVDNFIHNSPERVENLDQIVAVAGGTGHSLALRSDGTVWAWGHNENGQLGDGTRINSATPVQVVGLSDVDLIAAGYLFSIAVDRNGTLWTWGSSLREDGEGDARNDSLVPRKIPFASGAD
jgi:alpha-tubulin suppressor-like RCC1 family protein